MLFITKLYKNFDVVLVFSDGEKLVRIDLATLALPQYEVAMSIGKKSEHCANLKSS